MPVPLRARAPSPRANRSNACGASSGGKPSPSSLTAISQQSVLPAGGDPDLAGAVAQRIVDEVAERLAAAQRIDRRMQVRGGVHRDLATLLARPVREALLGALEQLADLDVLGPHRQLPVGGTRDQQQVLGELGEVVGLLERGDQRLTYA